MLSMTQLRRWHAYTGLFIAPSVLFFALTGAVQLFNLHEAHGNYRPAAVLAELSAVHKDQVFEAPHADEHPAAAEEPRKSPVPMYLLKWFFLIVSLGLIGSTLIGTWMGLTQIGHKGLAWTLLIAGTLGPIGLLLVGYSA